MKPLPPRLPSASARWALRLAAFAPFLGIVSVLAHRSQLIDHDAFDVLVVFILALTLFALFLVLMSFRSLWVRGTRGGRRASWALFFCALVLVPYLAAGVARWSHPPQNDTTTDVIVPPLFLDELRTIEGDARAVIAARLNDGYPDLEGQRFRVDMETVNSAIQQVARARGLSLTERRGRIGANDEVFLEYGWQPLIIRWPHEAVIRLTDEGETTYVDIRSRSLRGSHDGGSNMRMIVRFQDALDSALIGAVSQ